MSQCADTQVPWFPSRKGGSRTRYRSRSQCAGTQVPWFPSRKGGIGTRYRSRSQCAGTRFPGSLPDRAGRGGGHGTDLGHSVLEHRFLGSLPEALKHGTILVMAVHRLQVSIARGGGGGGS
jgi:hypothetical protein